MFVLDQAQETKTYDLSLQARLFVVHQEYLRVGRRAENLRADSLTPDERQRSARNAGKIGGKARLIKMTPEQRSEIARKAALARWGK